MSGITESEGTIHLAVKERRRHEKEALDVLAEVLAHDVDLDRIRLPKHRRRINDEQGRRLFEFGDMTLDGGSRWVVVEVESAGGVTNLVKYWYLLRHGLLPKPHEKIALLHLFRQTSRRDYDSHRLLWALVAEQMRSMFPDKFIGLERTYRAGANGRSDLKEAARILRSWLDQEPGEL